MIADAIRQAQELAKKAQQATYTGRCTVSEYRKVKDPKTKITSEKSVAVLEDQPCRLSYSSVSAVDQSDTAAKTAQVKVDTQTVSKMLSIIRSSRQNKNEMCAGCLYQMPRQVFQMHTEKE